MTGITVHLREGDLLSLDGSVYEVYEVDSPDSYDGEFYRLGELTGDGGVVRHADTEVEKMAEDAMSVKVTRD